MEGGGGAGGNWPVPQCGRWFHFQDGGRGTFDQTRQRNQSQKTLIVKYFLGSSVQEPGTSTGCRGQRGEPEGHRLDMQSKKATAAT